MTRQAILTIEETYKHNPERARSIIIAELEKERDNFQAKFHETMDFELHRKVSLVQSQIDFYTHLDENNNTHCHCPSLRTTVAREFRYCNV
jgi:hypothetical protein